MISYETKVLLHDQYGLIYFHKVLPNELREVLLAELATVPYYFQNPALPSLRDLVRRLNANQDRS